MTEFKVLPRFEATRHHPEAFIDPEFFVVHKGQLFVTQSESDYGLVADFAPGLAKKTVACLQARLWSDYARRYLGEQLKKSQDQSEKIRLHAEAVKARDTECMWIVWGWDSQDFPHLQGREKYAEAPATPEGCC